MERVAAALHVLDTIFYSIVVLTSILPPTQEFNLLTPNNTIYKLIGSALVKQDPVEAKANVAKRIEFIKNEM